MSDPQGIVHLVTTAHIRLDVGVTQVVKLRLNPSRAQVELLLGYCGTARAAYNTLLFQVKANIGQRAAEKTYDILDSNPTPGLSWHRFGLEKLLRENRGAWLPWYEQIPALVLDWQAHQLADGLKKWKAGTAKFPRFRKKRGADAGLVPVTFKETGAVWLTGGGRALALPISAVTRRELGRARSVQLSSVLSSRTTAAGGPQSSSPSTEGRSRRSPSRSRVGTGGRPCGCGCCRPPKPSRPGTQPRRRRAP